MESRFRWLKNISCLKMRREPVELKQNIVFKDWSSKIYFICVLRKFHSTEIMC